MEENIYGYICVFFLKEKIGFPPEYQLENISFFSVVISAVGLFVGKTALVVVIFVFFGKFTNQIMLSQRCFCV